MSIIAPKILNLNKEDNFNLELAETEAPELSQLSTHPFMRAIAWRTIFAALLTAANLADGASIPVPNYSFESPVVPPVAPYAAPDIDFWQKSPQPFWYNPTNNNNPPWDYLMGSFFNVPFPGSFIDNCDGSQASFLFAVPNVARFQDYDTIYGTNTSRSHAFNANFNSARS